MHPEYDIYSVINVFHLFFFLQKYVFITPQSSHMVWRNTRYITDRLTKCAPINHTIDMSFYNIVVKWGYRVDLCT